MNLRAFWQQEAEAIRKTDEVSDSSDVKKSAIQKADENIGFLPSGYYYKRDGTFVGFKATKITFILKKSQKNQGFVKDEVYVFNEGIDDRIYRLLYQSPSTPSAKESRVQLFQDLGIAIQPELPDNDPIVVDGLKNFFEDKYQIIEYPIDILKEVTQREYIIEGITKPLKHTVFKDFAGMIYQESEYNFANELLFDEEGQKESYGIALTTMNFLKQANETNETITNRTYKLESVVSSKNSYAKGAKREKAPIYAQTGYLDNKKMANGAVINALFEGGKSRGSVQWDGRDLPRLGDKQANVKSWSPFIPTIIAETWKEYWTKGNGKHIIGISAFKEFILKEDTILNKSHLAIASEHIGGTIFWEYNYNYWIDGNKIIKDLHEKDGDFFVVNKEN